MKIRHISVTSNKMQISSHDLVKLCEKFDRVVCTHEHFNPTIWNDNVLTKILPACSIIRKERYVIYNPPELITDATLDALISYNSVPREFRITGVENAFTIETIVNKLEILDNRDVANLSLDLGILQPDQATEAEHYFKKVTGELIQQYRIIEYPTYVFHFYTIKSLVLDKFCVNFWIRR